MGYTLSMFFPFWLAHTSAKLAGGWLGFPYPLRVRGGRGFVIWGDPPLLIVCGVGYRLVLGFGC